MTILILISILIVASFITALLRAGFALCLRRIGSMFYAWAVAWEDFRLELARLDTGALGEDIPLLTNAPLPRQFTVSPDLTPASPK